MLVKKVSFLRSFFGAASLLLPTMFGPERSRSEGIANMVRKRYGNGTKEAIPDSAINHIKIRIYIANASEPGWLCH